MMDWKEKYWNKVVCGYNRVLMPELPDESVHCAITSPPYWGLRDYGLEPLIWDGDEDCEHEWEMKVVDREFHQTGATGRGSKTTTIHRSTNESGFCSLCSAWRGSLGLEPTPELYVQHLVQIFREVRRVLRKDGVLFLNIGDSYFSSQNMNRNNATGTLGGKIRGGGEYKTQQRYSDILKPKDLCGIPWRVAFALQADGWWLRSDIIWHKPNPMPESVKDRPTKAHEYVFLLSKSKKYYYDQDAIREPHSRDFTGCVGKNNSRVNGVIGGQQPHRGLMDAIPNPNGRNKRSVWTIPTQPYPEAHFATFPEALVEPMIKAGCPVRGIVLDPFCGSGTVGVVCRKLDRQYIMMDLSPEYCEMSRKRIPIYAQIGMGI